jgi:Ricin-type beta-trefoil lectin domain-like
MGVEGKYFIVISNDSGRVLEIKGGRSDAGAEVILWDRHGGDNQVWFQDPVTGTIRSKLNPKLCLAVDG